MSASNLPETHTALVITDPSQPLQIKTVSTPRADAGSAVVRVRALRIFTGMRDLYNGKRPFHFQTPMVAGQGGVGHVAAVGPDATSLKPGQLVYINQKIHTRDDPESFMFQAFEQGTAPSLMEGEWRDGTLAEYVKMPLENLIPLNETRLVKELGYTLEDLTFLMALAPAMGGLCDVNVRPSETVVVLPGTGGYGSAAVILSVALGAGKVIAMGRNVAELEKVAALSDLIVTIPTTGDQDAEVAAIRAQGPVDVVFDISPAGAEKSTYLKSAILALRPGGRVSLMGGYFEDVQIPHFAVMFGGITLKGTMMCTREQLELLIKMLETGILRLGEEAGIRTLGPYGLDDWETAFASAAKNTGFGDSTVMKP